MKINKITILSLFIVLICFIGAASAAEDVNDTAIVDSAIDEVSAVEIDESLDNEDEITEIQNIEESNNVLASGTTTTNLNSKLSSKTKLGASCDEILSGPKSDVIYVNGSLDDETDVSGADWENAYGGSEGLFTAFMKLNPNGIIYAYGVFDMADFDYVCEVAGTNFTVIGQGLSTSMPIVSLSYGTGYDKDTHTYINLTLTGKDFGINSNFINCAFTGPISISKDLLNYEPRHIEEYGCAKTYFMNFDNCTFKDVTTNDALVTLYKYGAVTFNNCTFENITADSIVYHNDSSYFEEDGITFKECTFTNCKYNGIADSLANFDDAIVIEDCTYDSDVALGTTEVDGHFYVNATKLKVVALETTTTITGENGIVTITVKDSENKSVANAEVKYTVNGENRTGVTDENGTITISDLTGETTVTANFTGNDAYLASVNTASFTFKTETANTTTPSVSKDTSKTTTTSKVVKKATKITAKKATFKAKKKSKKYTITLKSGKKAVKKVKVTIKVGKKTYTARTNSKGKATFNLKKLTKKGRYTAVIKFAGDKNYKATTKKVKITVKK